MNCSVTPHTTLTKAEKIETKISAATYNRRDQEESMG
jgi:hypothetical protein